MQDHKILRYPALKPYDYGIDSDENGMTIVGSYNDTVVLADIFIDVLYLFLYSAYVVCAVDYLRESAFILLYRLVVCSRRDLQFGVFAKSLDIGGRREDV